MSPNSVRSTVPASSMPIRSFPYGSTPLPTKAARELDRLRDALDRQVAFDDELVAASLDRGRLEAKLRVSLRCRRSRAIAGGRRGFRRRSRWWTTSTVPEIDGVSPPSIVPENPGTRPLTVASPSFLTSNSRDDQTGSIDQVSARDDGGRSVCDDGHGHTPLRSLLLSTQATIAREHA